MSGFNSLAESLQRIYSEISQVESVAKKNPGDVFVLANLHSLQRRAEILEQEWEDAALHVENEVCRYRILPAGEERYPIRYVTQSLWSFQELFSQLFDAAINKIKSRKRLSPEVTDLTALNFGYAYPGSLGVAMTLPSESTLFGTSKFDDTIAALIEVMRLSDESEVRHIAETYGIAVIRRAYDWSRTNAQGGYGIDLTWVHLRGERRGTVTQLDDFERIVELISRTSDQERRTRRIYGMLVGIDTQTKRFRFYQANGPTYAGHLAPEFPETVRWSVNTFYVATIEITSTISYATEETKTTFTLKALGSQEDTPIDEDDLGVEQDVIE